MITRLYVDNYKCLVNFELKPGPITLLLGPNGGGKSTLFEVMELLRGQITGEFNLVGEVLFDTLTRWQDRPTQTFEVDFKDEEGLYQYRVVLAPRVGRASQVVHEHLLFDEHPLFLLESGIAHFYLDDFSESQHFDLGQSDLRLLATMPHRSARVRRFKERFARAVHVRLDPQLMTPSFSRDWSWPVHTFENFSGWFHHLSLEAQGRVLETTVALRSVIDGFDSFKVSTNGGEGGKLGLVFRTPGQKRSSEYSLDEISDGQRALVALYTCLHCVLDDGDGLWVEPENYLALPEIQPWLLEAIDRVEDGRGQLLLASHHPELIDYLASSCSYWLERDDGGATRVRPITPDSSGFPISELVARGWLHG